MGGSSLILVSGPFSAEALVFAVKLDIIFKNVSKPQAELTVKNGSQQRR